MCIEKERGDITLVRMRWSSILAANVAPLRQKKLQVAAWQRGTRPLPRGGSSDLQLPIGNIHPAA